MRQVEIFVCHHRAIISASLRTFFTRASQKINFISIGICIYKITFVYRAPGNAPALHNRELIPPNKKNLLQKPRNSAILHRNSTKSTADTIRAAHLR